MQHINVAAAPRRSLLWDEASARYIWLDQNAKAAAANLRAKRAADAFADSLSSGAYSCAIGDLWDSSNYDQASSRARYQAEWRARRKQRAACDMESAL